MLWMSRCVSDGCESRQNPFGWVHSKLSPNNTTFEEGSTLTVALHQELETTLEKRQ